MIVLGRDTKQGGLQVKHCTDCKHSGMDMDMGPYCAHPDVLKTNSFGSSCNVVRGASLPLGDSRRKLPHYGVCGAQAKLFSVRKRT